MSTLKWASFMPVFKRFSSLTFTRFQSSFPLRHYNNV